MNFGRAVQNAYVEWLYDLRHVPPSRGIPFQHLIYDEWKISIHRFERNMTNTYNDTWYVLTYEDTELATLFKLKYA